MDVSELLEELGSLNKDDLQKVRVATSHLLGKASQKINIVDVPEEQSLAFEAMVVELRKAGLREEVSFERFSQTTAYKGHWKRSVKEIETFLNREFPGVNKNDRRWFYRLGFSLLLSNMKYVGIPTGLGSLAANTDRMLEQIDRAFPDYIACGLGLFIMKAAEQRTRDGA